MAEQLPLPAARREEFQSRYVAFARAHGRTPEEQRAHDAAQPGRNVEFMAWIGARWREYRAANGMRENDPVGPHQDAFDAWLDGAANG